MKGNYIGKLAFVFPSAYLHGGVQTWLDYIIPGLATIGWSVTAMVTDGDQHDARKYLHIHPFGNFYIVTNPTGSREGRVKSLLYALKTLQPDIVLCVNIIDVYFTVARLRFMGVRDLRVVMALHGFNGSFFADMALFKGILDGVISTNQLGVTAGATIGGMDPWRLFYAPCGVEIGNLPEVSFSDDTLSLLYAGRLDQNEKYIHDLPRILLALERRGVKYKLRLAGTGPDEAELRRALSHFEGRVEFLGHLDEVSLNENFYQPGAILVITSPSESGPLVAWEAMARGVTIVTSSYLGIASEGSFRSNHNCMVFPVSDTEAAAEAILKVRDIDYRKHLIQNGFDLVKRKYSHETSILAWHNALQKITKLPSQPLSGNLVDSSESGRLDRYFGTSIGEIIRKCFWIKYKHEDPGGEWPHSYSKVDERAFRERLRLVDLEPGCVVRLDEKYV
jgi:glycosyltransferase involved in cell wall biosynthesis